MPRRKQVGGAAIAAALALAGAMSLPTVVGVSLFAACAAAAMLAFFPSQIRGAVRRLPILNSFRQPLDRAIAFIAGDFETIPAGQALEMLAGGRPNSIETTESRLRDKASIGAVRAWGKKIPLEAIPTYFPSLEEIPVSTWGYAGIDLNSISGPLATNSLSYLRPSERNPNLPLYNAVRFSKEEIADLCRTEDT